MLIKVLLWFAFLFDQGFFKNKPLHFYDFILSNNKEVQTMNEVQNWKLDNLKETTSYKIIQILASLL
jgi:hypothetical protein